MGERFVSRSRRSSSSWAICIPVADANGFLVAAISPTLTDLPNRENVLFVFSFSLSNDDETDTSVSFVGEMDDWSNLDVDVDILVLLRPIDTEELRLFLIEFVSNKSAVLSTLFSSGVALPSTSRIVDDTLELLLLALSLQLFIPFKQLIDSEDDLVLGDVE
jgi:hypothetical protein